MLASLQGNYDTFERTMTERLRNLRKQAEAQNQKRQHVQAFIDRFRYVLIGCPAHRALTLSDIWCAPCFEGPLFQLLYGCKWQHHQVVGGAAKCHCTVIGWSIKHRCLHVPQKHYAPTGKPSCNDCITIKWLRVISCHCTQHALV